jgi:CRP/FNR family transcriptional regulator, cyclic AMP receptor protein
MKNFYLKNNQPVFKGRSGVLLTKETQYPNFRAKKIPFLSNISEKALANLIGKAKTLRYTKKADIDSECNKANSIVIIFSGNVWVGNRNDRIGTGTMFQVEEPRSGYGKIALLTDELRTVSVITLEKTVFAVILKSDFTGWLMNYPDVEFTILGVFKEKLAS